MDLELIFLYLLLLALLGGGGITLLLGANDWLTATYYKLQPLYIHKSPFPKDTRASLLYDCSQSCDIR